MFYTSHKNVISRISEKVFSVEYSSGVYHTPGFLGLPFPPLASFIWMVPFGIFGCQQTATIAAVAAA